MTDSRQDRAAAAVERAYDQTQETLETLVNELARGKSDTLVAVLRAFGTFHDYSFRNTMLIISQYPTACRVAGFRAWKKLGRYVRKGEKGIVILVPMRRRQDDAEENADAQVRDVYGFRPARVFDVAQTEGEPLPELEVAQGDPGRHTERVRQFAAQRGIRIDYEDSLGSASGLSTGGRIIIRRNLAPGDEFATLVHEIAHELLHQGIPRERRPPHTVRETEAEAVAFAVCSAVGLDAKSAARDYIHSQDGDAEVLTASFDRVHGVCSSMVSYLKAEAGAAVVA